MRMWTQLATLVAACALAAGCQLQKPSTEWEGLLRPEVLQAAGLEYYWHGTSPLGAGESVRRLYQLDENLYCLTNQNRLIAISADKGILKWARPVATPEQTVFRPVHANGVTLPPEVAGMAEILSKAEPPPVKPYGVVMVNSLNRVMVLDRAGGEVIRDIPLPLAASTGGATDGERYYVGTARGWFYAMRLREAVRMWTRSAEDAITAPLEFSDGRLFVASEDGTFTAWQGGDEPKKIWTQKTYGRVIAAFLADGRGCFVGSQDSRLYAYGPANGVSLWEPLVCKGPIMDPVQADQTTLFQYARGDQFYAVDLASGRVRWANREARQVLAVMDGNVYALDLAGNLLILDEMLGKVMHSLPLTGLHLFAANTKTPAIFAATAAGRLFCIRLASAGHLTVEKLNVPASAAAP